jgi:hypothetical protein
MRKRAGEYRMTEMERIVAMRRAGMESKVVSGDGLAIVKRVVDSALGGARNFEDSIAIGSAAWFCSTSHAMQRACAREIFVHAEWCVQKLLQHTLTHTRTRKCAQAIGVLPNAPNPERLPDTIIWIDAWYLWDIKKPERSKLFV